MLITFIQMNPIWQFVMGLLLISLGAAFGWVGATTAAVGYQRFVEKVTYKYAYFNRDMLGAFERVNTSELMRLRNRLDLNKSRADSDWLEKVVSITDIEKERLRKINDYAFRFYRDFVLLQALWFRDNGRFFQGKPTTQKVPDFNQDASVIQSFGLTDQIEDWRDVGYVDRYAPLQITSDVYEMPTPNGHGYQVTLKVSIEGVVWTNKLHVGPDAARDEANMMWRQN
jgi:hypothetical protein